MDLEISTLSKSESESRSVLSSSLRRHGLHSPWNFQARTLEWVPVPFSRGSSIPGMEPRSPALQADSLLAEPPGKPKNSGTGSLFLQWILPTQESNQGLLHYRWILNQLSHKGSPRIQDWVTYPFSRGSSRPKNQTRVSCIAEGFFTNWAVREAHPFIPYPLS